jgi:hypothetical protein
VAGVEEMNLGVREVTSEGARAVRPEDLVVLAPHDEGRRLVIAEVLLESRILVDVEAIVAEQRELDVLVARTIEQRLVEHPRVG